MLLCRSTRLGRVAASRTYSTALAVHTVNKPIHRFFHILDGIEPSGQMSSLFASPEATLHISKASAVLSGDEIDDWVARMQAGWRGAATLHSEANIILDHVEENVVVSHSTWTAIIDGAITAYGTHADVLEAVKSEDGELEWKFRRRVVRHLYSAA